MDELHSKIFLDQTGTFPYRSSRGMRYVMVVLECNTNYIMVEGMQDRMAGKMVQAYQQIIDQRQPQLLWTATPITHCHRKRHAYSSRAYHRDIIDHTTEVSPRRAHEYHIYRITHKCH